MDYQIPNIRHLRVFVAVADNKSISKASDKVFLSQPAITQAISKLETLLDASLFQRRSDGMYVTESGKVLVMRVRRSLEMIADGVKSALRLGGGKGQVVQLVQMLKTTQMRALIAVSEAQNFSVAGRNLGVSQSALHRAARELEDLLGVVLFEKTSTGISTSKAARALSKACKLAFAEIRQGRDEVNSLHNREIGEIVIGSMPLARTSLLPKAIIELSRRFPDFRIQVNDGPYDDLLYHLRHGDIDLLVGALRFPPPSDDVIQEELFSSPVAIIGRAGHPLAQLSEVDISVLAEYPWVVPRRGTPTRSIFESAFTEAGMAVPSRLVECSSQILVRSLLMDSDRLTIISEHQVQHELSLGLLGTIPYNLAHSSRPIGLTFRRSWKPTKTQNSLVQLLRNG